MSGPAGDDEAWRYPSSKVKYWMGANKAFSTLPHKSTFFILVSGPDYRVQSNVSGILNFQHLYKRWSQLLWGDEVEFWIIFYLVK